MYRCNICGHSFSKPERFTAGSEYCGVYSSETCELCPECESEDIERDNSYDEYDCRDRDRDVLGRYNDE